MTQIQQVNVATSFLSFDSKEQLKQYYKSDLHYYNLKRKSAGLAPVNSEWFEQRKSHLQQNILKENSVGLGSQQVYICPVTKKSFQSLNAYQNYISSKKYYNKVKETGLQVDQVQPLVKDRQQQTQGQKKLLQNQLTQRHKSDTEFKQQKQQDEQQAQGDEYETDSNDSQGMIYTDKDQLVSLFDNYKSTTIEENLIYMERKFGFKIPEQDYIVDIKGLLKYLGAKLKEGHIPLYISGLDANAKRFKSLHAVLRHMIDTNNCRMLLDNNEEEYEDYYNYDKLNKIAQQQDKQSQIEEILQDDSELVVRLKDGSEKCFGSRAFKKYYKQQYKPEEYRQSIISSTLNQRARLIGYNDNDRNQELWKHQQLQSVQRLERNRLKIQMNQNIIGNLPRNTEF